MSKTQEQKREMIYNYWERLPLIVKVEYLKDEVFTHEVREIIVHHIRKGTEERRTNKPTKIQHAFSATELLNVANRKLKKGMKLQNIYFHLQKLQEFGLVKVVTTLLEGRHNVAYYGRTARGFIFESTRNKTRYEEFFLEAGKFANALNPKVSKEQFSKYFKEFNEINANSEKYLIQWLEDRNDIIDKSKTDCATLYSFLKRIYYQNKKMTSLMESIAEIIGLDL